MSANSKAYLVGGGIGYLAATCITDWLLPAFFKTEFWYIRKRW